MGSCLDLRKYQDGESIQDAFGALLSGRPGYKPIIERRIDPIKCEKCGFVIKDNSKFCPECGTLVKRKPTSTKCKKCTKMFDGEEKFCTDCGTQRE